MGMNLVSTGIKLEPTTARQMHLTAFKRWCKQIVANNSDYEAYGFSRDSIASMPMTFLRDVPATAVLA